jgi:hypothetical protein
MVSRIKGRVNNLKVAAQRLGVHGASGDAMPEFKLLGATAAHSPVFLGDRRNVANLPHGNAIEVRRCLR